jgi:hypothetical protein
MGAVFGEGGVGQFDAGDVDGGSFKRVQLPGHQATSRLAVAWRASPDSPPPWEAASRDEYYGAAGAFVVGTAGASGAFGGASCFEQPATITMRLNTKPRITCFIP